MHLSIQEFEDFAENSFNCGARGWPGLQQLIDPRSGQFSQMLLDLHQKKPPLTELYALVFVPAGSPGLLNC